MRQLLESIKAHPTVQAVHVQLGKQAELRGKEAFNEYIEHLNNSIFQLCNGTKETDKLEGIFLINALIDYECEYKDKQLQLFGMCLATLLSGSSGELCIRAAEALAHLSDSRGPLVNKIVDTQIQDALEWLNTGVDTPQRTTACTVIQYLAHSSHFRAHLETYAEYIWGALCDPRSATRIAASQSLDTCLSVVVSRTRVWKLAFYFKLWSHIDKVLNEAEPSVEEIHGALLGIERLVALSGDFMLARYKQSLDMMMEYTEHKSGLVRQSVIRLLPQFAVYSSHAFGRRYLVPSMHFIFGCLRNRFETTVCFNSIGEIARAMGGKLAPHLEDIVEFLVLELNVTQHKYKSSHDALLCLHALVQGVHSQLIPYTEELLSSIYMFDISEPLILVFRAFCEYIPQYADEIHEHILERISSTLQNVDVLSTSVSIGSWESDTLDPILSPRDDNSASSSTMIALSTLSSFDFDRGSLLPFVNDYVAAHFTNSGDVEVRRSAVLTCTTLLIRDELEVTNRTSLGIIQGLIAKLVVVSVCDPAVEVRRVVLRALQHPSFDTYLISPECLKPLLILFKDEDLSIRKLSASIVGRLCIYNPSYVLPSLRKELMEILMVMYNSKDVAVLIASTVIVRQLVMACKYLIIPYVDVLLDALLVLLHHQGRPMLALSSLEAIASVSLYGAASVSPHIGQVYGVISQVLQASATEPKLRALRALGELAEYTGHLQRDCDMGHVLPVVFSCLDSSYSWAIRHEAIRVLGILGAYDPYLYSQASIAATSTSTNNTSTSLLAHIEHSYYAETIVCILLQALDAPHQFSDRYAIVRVIMFNIESVANIQDVLPLVMQGFLHLTRTGHSSLRALMFTQLARLVEMQRYQLQDEHLEDLFELVHYCWNISIVPKILELLESMSRFTEHAFRSGLPRVLPRLVTVLESSTSSAILPTLDTLTVIGESLGEYLDLLVPPIVDLCESDKGLDIRIRAVGVIGDLGREINLSAYSSKIIHSLARVLKGATMEQSSLQEAILSTFGALMSQSQYGFVIFAPMLQHIVSKKKIGSEHYQSRVTTLLTKLPLPTMAMGASTRVKSVSVGSNEFVVLLEDTMDMDEMALTRVWVIEEGFLSTDWDTWLRKLAFEMIRQSPLISLRSCAGLVQRIPSLVLTLLNHAFLSCWRVMGDHARDSVSLQLGNALNSSSIPAQVVQSLLSLTEFMDRSGNELPLSSHQLCSSAYKGRAFAKALYHAEKEWRTSPEASIDTILSIHSALGQTRAGAGIVSASRTRSNIKWYEELEKWSDALREYERRQLECPHDKSLTLGRLRCLGALGDPKRVLLLAKRLLEEDSDWESVAPLAVTAAWRLQDWGMFDACTASMKQAGNKEALFYEVVSLVRDRDHSQALVRIEQVRGVLYTGLSTLLRESYTRAYPLCVRAQELRELEEVILYQQSGETRRTQIQGLWRNRLLGCDRDAGVWQRLLSVRSLVLRPHQQIDTWLEYAVLCGATRSRELSRRVLDTLMDDMQPNSLDRYRVQFAFIEHLWDSNQKSQALSEMSTLTSALDAIESPLRSQCHLRMSQWGFYLRADTGSVQGGYANLLWHVQEAASCAPESSRAQHWLAFFNCQALTAMSHQVSDRGPVVTRFGVPAVQALFKSIGLGGNKSLQDTLRLLSVWFEYGDLPVLEGHLRAGFNTVPIECWLPVIPQLIARLDAVSPTVRNLVHSLLLQLSAVHPQALIYPLVVAAKSDTPDRRVAAQSLLDAMRNANPALVAQAISVSKELMRVATVWHELWHTALEKASTLFYGSHNPKGMLEVLNPLFDMMEKGPQTPRETSFMQIFGRDLASARDWCRRYEALEMESDLNCAWQIFVRIWSSIDRICKSFSEQGLRLEQVSPQLLAHRDMQLAVPGTPVMIQSFDPHLPVLNSKQKPRKLTILGDDGKRYLFLLKGHEDLRQDERVMQLFSLVNRFMSEEQPTRDLSIRTYSAIPLSPSSGLIEWLDKCDTLHDLVSQYRKSMKISISLEKAFLFNYGVGDVKMYEKLTALQKLDVYGQTMDSTSGRDLAVMLWLTSGSAEEWLQRRTKYTRSVAVMSMTGYVLGLGDRHPGNLMVDRASGELIHIDFGDCFEVAMQRPQFPETVPFRLTRMMVEAMEVSGVEGNYRSTCEAVMEILRSNRESTMAVLEAFVHDPLINWRLTVSDVGKEPLGNARALEVTGRVRKKLTGRDFGSEEVMPVSSQVTRLINEATSYQHLAMLYPGWCPFW